MAPLPYLHNNPYARWDALEEARQTAWFNREAAVDVREREILDASEEFEYVLEYQLNSTERIYQLFLNALREAANGRPQRLQSILKTGARQIASEQVDKEQF